MPGLPPPTAVPEALYVGNSISLQAALLGAVTSNPDLVALRNSNVASAEAVEVARRFPTTLNPTLWVDFRPITLIPPDTFGRCDAGTTTGPFYHYGQVFYYSVLPPADRARPPDDPSLPHRPGGAATSRTGTSCRPS